MSQLGQSETPIWLQADPSSSKALFASPNDLWEAAQSYFNWAMNNPILNNIPVVFRGVRSFATESKPRALSIRGFATYCGVSVKKIEKYRTMDGFDNVMDVVDQIIYTQKFEYAAVNIMNPGLIARDLDISEKIDIGGGKRPVKTINVNALSTDTLEEILNAQEEDDSE